MPPRRRSRGKRGNGPKGVATSPSEKKVSGKAASARKLPPATSPGSHAHGTRSAVFLKDPPPRPLGYNPDKIQKHKPVASSTAKRLPTHPKGPSPKKVDEEPTPPPILDEPPTEQPFLPDTQAYINAPSPGLQSLETKVSDDILSPADGTVMTISDGEGLSPDRPEPINLHKSLLDVKSNASRFELTEDFKVRDIQSIDEVIDVDEEIIEIFESPTKQNEMCSIPRGPEVQFAEILVNSGMRDFTYPKRRWIPRQRPPTFVPDPNKEVDLDMTQNMKVYEDDYGDFPTQDFDPPKTQTIVQGHQFPSILRAVEISDHWLEHDFVGYHTYYSQRSRSQYDDDSDYFAIYFPTGEQKRMHSLLTARKGDRIYDNADIRKKVLTACWKLFHPGSFYMYLQEKTFANPIKYAKLYTTRRKQLAETLGKVPLSFNIFNKRVLSIITSDNSHFVAYCVVNLGSWLTQEDKTEFGGNNVDPQSFIVDHDSMNNSPKKSTYELVYFLLEIARLLELWIAEYLALGVGAPLPEPPDHNVIISEARDTIQKTSPSSLLMTLPRLMPPDRPRQSDDFNCGVYAALNVFAVFKAENDHHVRLDLIKNIGDWNNDIVRPFWGLTENWINLETKMADCKRLTERAMSFRYCLLNVMCDKFYKTTVESEIEAWHINYLLTHGRGHLLPKEIHEQIEARRFALEPLPGPYEELVLSEWGCHYLHMNGFDDHLPGTVRAEVIRRKEAGASMPIKSREFQALYRKFRVGPTVEEFNACKGKKFTKKQRASVAAMRKRIAELKQLAMIEDAKKSGSTQTEQIENDETQEAAKKEEAAKAASLDDQLTEKQKRQKAQLAKRIQAAQIKGSAMIQDAKKGDDKLAKKMIEAARIRVASERLGIPEGAAEGTATANAISQEIDTQTPTKKEKKKREDKTAEGIFFSQGEATAAEQKQHTERIRRRRGHVRRRLKWKKSEAEKQAYARHHEAIFTQRENAVAAKHKRYLERSREKDDKWQVDLQQLDVILLQSQRLSQKDQKTVSDLLSQNFPDQTPPSSDAESVCSLDSQLTSDTSDDGCWSDQDVSSRSIRKMARVQKGELKKIRNNERRKRKRDAEMELAEYASRDANPTLTSDALQISKLRYIPVQQVKENEDLDFTTGVLAVAPRSKKKFRKLHGTVKFYHARYQSLTINAQGKTAVNHSISTSWVAGIFTPRFLELVRSVGTKEDQNKVAWSKRRWIHVPAGCASDNEPPNEIICPSIRCRYLQHEFNTCVFMSMASVFHHAGRKETANYLASISHARGSEDWDARSQLDRLMVEVRKRELVYCKVDFRSSRKAVAKVKIFEPDLCPQLWLLLGRDGGTNHAIGVFGKYVFDSNVGTALTLSQRTLDWCSNCKEGFSRIHMYVRFGR
jgi:hypothetical protein